MKQMVMKNNFLKVPENIYKEDSTEWIKKILKNTGDIDYLVSSNNDTTFLKSVEYNAKNIMEYCINNKCNVNITNNKKQNAIHRAIISFTKHTSSEDYSIIRYLVKLGVNINAKDKYGDTPLHYSTYLNMYNDKDNTKREKLILVLLELGGDHEAINQSAYKPFDTLSDEYRKRIFANHLKNKIKHLQTIKIEPDFEI